MLSLSLSLTVGALFVRCHGGCLHERGLARVLLLLPLVRA